MNRTLTDALFPPVAETPPLLPAARGIAALPGTLVEDALELAGGGVRPLDDPLAVWLVEDGGVEVFAAGEDGGERLFLHAVETGGLLFPAPCDAGTDAGTVRVVAVAQAPARLRCLRLSGAAPPPVDAEHAAPLAAAIDRWIAALATVLPQPQANRSPVRGVIAAGEQATVECGGRLTSRAGVTWAHVESGAGRLNGREILAGVGDALVPLTPAIGVEATATLTARGYATAGMLRVAGWFDRVAGFNRSVVAAVAVDLHHAADREQDRLRALNERTLADRRRTLARFVTLLDEKGPRVAVPEGATPLFAACHRVAAALGHVMRPPGRNGAALAGDGGAPSGEGRMAAVARVARFGRLRSRPIALRGAWWREDLGPLVGFQREDGTPVALLPGRGGYRMVAADGTETRIADPKAAEAVAPLVAVLYAPFPDRKLTYADLIRFGLGRSKADILLILLMGALAGLLGMVTPMATALIFDSIVPGHERGRLLEVGAALLVSAVALTLFRLVSDLTTLRVEGRIAGGLQAAVLDRILRLPASVLNGFSSADLTMRALVVDSMRQMLTGVVLSSLLAGVFSLFSLGLLFHYEPRAALLATLLFLLLVGATAWAGLAQLRALFEGEALDANIFGLVLETLNGVAKLRLAGAEDRAFIRWGRVFGEVRSRATRSRRITNRLAVFTAAFDVVATAAMFWVVARLSVSPLTAGEFLAFIAAFTSFMAAAYQTSHAVMSVYRIVPMARRAQPILDALPESDDSKDDPGRLGGAIEVNAVTFRYAPGMPLVLAGVTLSVKPGAYVAVVGASGSGKSTLVRLLLGFEKPETGGVFYDGQDLRGLDLPSVRRQIGVVLQTSRLMAGSIFENIRGVTDAGEADIWEALRMAGVEEDVRALPMGLHTVLTEGSSTLSGGQLQRLMIARALIGKPRILLFDEATSALDNRTQAMVTQSLDRLPVTRIVIAHRLSTVINADRIFVMKRGRIAEQGGYAELMAKNGAFAELVRRQMV